ncbi:hypothetical protein BTI247_59570 (plasmid) [Bacillus thuringiensis Bt18247]|uniref:Uncharacterized protein n=1 Tax=Bacillus thuringiensis Bt18247 TaxID=1423143 RepID=A0A9W3XBZ3_BACTU|nr:hypothetical protein BTI247_59570 [Bacillus thuringiensis Bt18247]
MYKLYKMKRNGRSPDRDVVIEQATVDRNTTKMFDKRFQRGDYYVGLECNRGGPGRGEYEGSLFITIIRR